MQKLLKKFPGLATSSRHNSAVITNAENSRPTAKRPAYGMSSFIFTVTVNRRNRTLFTSQKKTPALSQTVANARIAPKICQGQPPAFGSQCSKFHPNRFIFGGVIAERVKAVLLAHRVFATFVFGRIKSSKTENCSEGLSQDNCCNNGIPQYGSLNTQ